MITSSILGDWEALDSRSLEGEWNGLVERSAANEIFSRAEWLRAWGKSRTRESCPHMVLLRDSGRLVAIAPLMRARRRFLGVGVETVEFAGAPNSDYSDFIFEDPRYLEPLWKIVGRQAREVDVLRLQQVRMESPTCRFLVGRGGVIARPCAMGLFVRLPECPQAPVEAYLKGRGLRKRTVLRIERERPVELIAHEGPEEILAHLPVLFDQHIRRWAGTRTQSFFRHESIRELYRNWASELGERAAFWELRLRGQPVATLFGFVYDRKLVVHTISFDVDYYKFHCGLYCILSVMRTLRERGIEWVDFSRGSEAFKFHFADQKAVNYEFHGLQTWKARCAAGGVLAAKDLVRRWPPAGRMARALGYGVERVETASA